MAGWAASGFLAAIGSELDAQGLTVAERRLDGALVQIDVSAPEHPERGSVRIGYDGFLLWEQWDSPGSTGSRAAGIVRLITRVLMDERPASADDSRD